VIGLKGDSVGPRHHAVEEAERHILMLIQRRLRAGVVTSMAAQ
jgi:hypothetical protein